MTAAEKRLARLNSVIQTDATASGNGDFFLTHAPFRNIQVGRDSFIDEETLFRDYLVENPEQHKFIMVQGESGSGKSHLIRWLYEKYKRTVDLKKEAVITISKAHNNLSEAIAQIMNSGYFPEEVQKSILGQLQQSRGKYNDEEFKRFIIFNYQVIIRKDLNGELPSQISSLLDFASKNKLIFYLEDEFILKKHLLVDGGPLERMQEHCETTNSSHMAKDDEEIFTEDDFRISNVEIQNNIAPTAHPKTKQLAMKLISDQSLGAQCADYLNSMSSLVAQGALSLNSVDFRKTFQDLRIDLKKRGMNLTLFIEDINSCSGIDDALMDCLVSEHTVNRNCCRLISVVGSTEWFYKNKLPDAIQQRVTANFKLSQESILSTDRIAEFTARYINAINLDDADVTDWLNKGAHTDLAPVSNSEKKYSFSTVPVDGQNLSIFPFNRNALINLFNGLSVTQNEERTPRRFLNHILYPVLTKWYSEGIRFLEDQNTFVSDYYTIPPWTNELYETQNRNMEGNCKQQRAMLIRIWGNAVLKQFGKEYGGLSEDVFEAFSVQFPGDTGDTGEIDGTDEKGNEGSTIQPPPPPPPPVNLDYKKCAEDIAGWFSEKHSKLVHHEELRDALCAYIRSNFPFIEYSINYSQLGSFLSRRHFVIENQTASFAVGYYYELKCNEETKKLLIALANWLYVGKRSWAFENGLDYLVEVQVWMERHTNDIKNFLLHSDATNSSEEMELQAVSAVSYAKLLSEKTTFNGSAEDLMIELFATPPEYKEDPTGVHSKCWTSLWAEYKKSTELYPAFVSYFAKKIGKAKETEFTFIDADKLLGCIRKLKEENWNIKISEKQLPDSSDSRLYIPRLIQQFQQEKAVLENDEYTICRQQYREIAEYFDMKNLPESVKDTVEEMRSILQYFSKKLGLGYRSEDFIALNDPKIAEKIESELNRLNTITKLKGYSLLTELSGHVLQNGQRISKLLSSCRDTLQNKAEMFEGGDGSKGNLEITQKKNNILQTLPTIRATCQQLGGGK